VLKIITWLYTLQKAALYISLDPNCVMYILILHYVLLEYLHRALPLNMNEIYFFDKLILTQAIPLSYIT